MYRGENGDGAERPRHAPAEPRNRHPNDFSHTATSRKCPSRRDVGIAGIVAEPTPELIQLQQDLIVAVAPFTVETGTWTSFAATTADDPNNAGLIEYVSTYVPKMSREHFNPHVSTGVAPRAYLDKMLAEPFEPFTFSPAGAAVYQLGPFGTAAVKLKEWDLKPQGAELIDPGVRTALICLRGAELF
jgi:hypothetical protein